MPLKEALLTATALSILSACTVQSDHQGSNKFELVAIRVIDLTPFTSQGDAWNEDYFERGLEREYPSMPYPAIVAVSPSHELELKVIKVDSLGKPARVATPDEAVSLLERRGSRLDLSEVRSAPAIQSTRITYTSIASLNQDACLQYAKGRASGDEPIRHMHLIFYADGDPLCCAVVW